MSWDNALSRRQARTLRQLAEAYLRRLQAGLANTSPATPPEPGERTRPFIRYRLAIDDMTNAIQKLRRIEKS